MQKVRKKEVFNDNKLLSFYLKAYKAFKYSLEHHGKIVE